MTAKLTPTLLLAAVAIFAQSIDPDEVRGGSKPYTPPARGNTIRAQVNLVEVPVVVREGNHGVAGLQRADFQVSDSGHPREIVSFSVESRTAPGSSAAPAVDPAHAPATAPTSSPAPLPPSRRYIALLFDDLNINDGDLAPVRAAAKKYVKESLSAEDRVAVVTTASPKSANFTSDREDLSKQIDALRTHPHTGDNSGLNLECPSLNFYEAYLIANNLDNELLSLKVQEYYDCTHTPAPPGAGKAIPVQAKAKALWKEAKFNSEATLRVAQELVSALAPLEGRKAIVLTSSGFLTGELEPQLEEITHRAVRAGIVINSLEARGLWAPMGDIDKPSPYRTRGAAIGAGHQQLVQTSGQTAPDDGLAALAYGTGGRFFENSNDLYAGYRDLAGVPDTLYLLGIATGEVQDGKYHKLKVSLTKGHRGSVQARPGYMASLPSAIPPAPAERPIDRELLATGTLADVPVVIAAAPPAGTPAEVSVSARVDYSKLNFDQRNGRRKQSLTFVAELLDSNGTFVTGKEWHVDLSLKESTYLLFARKAVNVTLALPARPGKYTIRGVVEESLTGKMSAASLPMEIH
jgi:VWFA-related protein